MHETLAKRETVDTCYHSLYDEHLVTVKQLIYIQRISFYAFEIVRDFKNHSEWGILFISFSVKVF